MYDHKISLDFNNLIKFRDFVDEREPFFIYFFNPVYDAKTQLPYS